MKKLIVIGLMVMGISAFANSAENNGTIVSESNRLSKPIMLELYGDYGNR